MNALRTIEDCLGVLMCVCVIILHTTHAEMQAKCYLFLKAHHICIRVCKEFGIHHSEMHSKCRKVLLFIFLELLWVKRNYGKLLLSQYSGFVSEITDNLSRE